jgi:hypothetical protein
MTDGDLESHSPTSSAASETPDKGGPFPKLRSLFQRIEPTIRALAIAPVATKDMYDVALRAAFAKNFEFNSFVTQQHTGDNLFFVTGTLRGICEDIIGLKFAAPLPLEERSAFIVAVMNLRGLEGIRGQTEFFATNRPFQPVMTTAPFFEEKGREARETLRELGARHAWRTNRSLPSVRFMAEVGGLLPIYDYLYAATSEWVHFSPHVLLRMGWTKESLPTAKEFVFSTVTYTGYYWAFNLFYGSYLFALFCRTFCQYLDLSSAVLEAVAQIEQELDHEPRWPEVFTFEEYNIKPPHPLQYLLRALAYKADLKKRNDAAAGGADPSHE